MNLPERFDLTCINEQGEKERIVMIHSAIAGSFERGVAWLIEHYGGAFPLWLSPVQAVVLPIADAHQVYGTQVLQKLKEVGIRAEMYESNETLGKKIRDAKMQKIPYLLVVGDKEVEDNTATLESRTEKIGALPIEEIISKLKTEIHRRA